MGLAAGSERPRLNIQWPTRNRVGRLLAGAHPMRREQARRVFCRQSLCRILGTARPWTLAMRRSSEWRMPRSGRAGHRVPLRLCNPVGSRLRAPFLRVAASGTEPTIDRSFLHPGSRSVFAESFPRSPPEIAPISVQNLRIRPHCQLRIAGIPAHCVRCPMSEGARFRACVTVICQISRKSCTRDRFSAGFVQVSCTDVPLTRFFVHLVPLLFVSNPLSLPTLANIGHKGGFRR
jgi:hypothetical protein